MRINYNRVYINNSLEGMNEDGERFKEFGYVFQG